MVTTWRTSTPAAHVSVRTPAAHVSVRSRNRDYWDPIRQYPPEQVSIIFFPLDNPHKIPSCMKYEGMKKQTHYFIHYKSFSTMQTSTNERKLYFPCTQHRKFKSRPDGQSRTYEIFSLFNFVQLQKFLQKLGKTFYCSLRELDWLFV